MNASQILTHARRRYNAVGDNFYSDAELLEVLSGAEMELATETECIEERYTTTSVADQREYDMPSDYLKVVRVTYDGQRLDPQDFIEDDYQTGNEEDTTGTGTPTHYTVFNDTLFLRPVPNDAVTIEIFVKKEPSTLLITSSLSIPTRYHMYCVDYLLFSMFGKDKNHQMATYHLTLWEKNKERAKSFEMKRGIGDQYPVVKDVDQMPYHPYGSF